MNVSAFLSKELMSFVTVVEEGSFIAASKEMYVSQPALSRRVAQLENRLGVTLLDRTSSGVQLTDKGSMLYKYARQLKLLAHETIRQMTSGVSCEAKEIKIALITKNPYSFARKACIALHRLHPDIKISIVTSTIPNCVEELADGKFDIFVAQGLPWVRLKYPQVGYSLLFDEPIGVGFGSEHPFNGLSSVSPDMLAAQRVYTIPPGMIGGDYDILIKTLESMESPPTFPREKIDKDFYTKLEIENSLVLGACSYLADNTRYIPVGGHYRMGTYVFYNKDRSKMIPIFLQTAKTLLDNRF